MIDERDIYKRKIWDLSFNNIPEYALESTKIDNLATYIKRVSVPNLYRYRSFSEFSIDELENDCIFLSNPSTLNDPYEFYFCLEHIKRTTVLDDYGNRIPYNELMEIELEIQSKAYYRVGIACFSETNNSMLMWSHYSKNHKGFCLQYDFDELFCYANSKMMLYPIYYNDDIIKYNIHDLTHPTNRFKRLSFMFKKSTCWSYENEWRLLDNLKILPSGKGERIDFIRPKAIYLGSKMEEKDEKTIIEIAKNKGIEIFKMHRSFDKYEIKQKNYNKSYINIKDGL